MAWKNTKITFEPGFFLWVALLSLTVPVRFLAAVFVASAFHELCHLLALTALRYPVLSVSVGTFGVKINTAELSSADEVVCALAGPIGSFFLVRFARWIPAAATFAFCQSLYNLLPIYPMDGGRVFSCAVRHFFPEKVAGKILRVSRYFFLCFVMIGMTWVSFRFHFGIWPFIIGICLVFRAVKNK